MAEGRPSRTQLNAMKRVAAGETLWRQWVPSMAYLSGGGRLRPSTFEALIERGYLRLLPYRKHSRGDGYTLSDAGKAALEGE